MSERVQIVVAALVVAAALALMLATPAADPEPDPTPAPAPAEPHPDRQALLAAERAAVEAHQRLREDYAAARQATDWAAALDAADRGVERFPDPTTDRGGYWLKQRNHLSRLMTAEGR
jgi:hypothetical protein